MFLELILTLEETFAICKVMYWNLFIYSTKLGKSYCLGWLRENDIKTISFYIAEFYL